MAAHRRGPSRRLPTLPALTAAATLSLLLVGCDSGTTSSTGGPAGGAAGGTLTQTQGGGGSGVPATAAPIPGAALPFHYDGAGQGGSGAFKIPSDGTYTFSYTLKGDPGFPACTMSVDVAAPAGNKAIVDQAMVGPMDTKTGKTPLMLTAGTYSLIEGGGCHWTIDVTQGG